VRKIPLIDRCEAMIYRDPMVGCWIWFGSRFPGGYGRVNVNAKAKGQQAHRVLYELLVGPVPDELELDHVCRVKACVNPRHLEPVKHVVNVRRGDRMRRRSHCNRGHAMTKDNLYFSGFYAPTGRRNHHCRACVLLRGIARRESKRVATEATA
jgi:hypothetical protein